jgi:Mg-chelatase subunit ChlD
MILVSAILVYGYLKYIDKTPTCFDGIKNGKEEAVDCGGDCKLLCSVSNLNPIILWSKAFPVTDNVYNFVAYIQNPNINSEAYKVKYIFTAYDENGISLGQRSGSVSIPKNKKIAVFEGGFKSDVKIKRVGFEFVNNIDWYKPSIDKFPFIVSNQPIENQSLAPRIRGVIKNQSGLTYNKIELVAIIFDPKGNAVTSSKTEVDKLKGLSQQEFAFTWPRPLPETEAVCEVNSNIMLVLDRSGSMQSISNNPPQPLNDVKNTAINFISSLKYGDNAGVVSFANEASSPIDQVLTGDFKVVKNAISNIFIATSSLQNTNIGDGLEKAIEELNLSEKSDLRKNIIVLLTDGDPTNPTKANVSNYPALFAIEKANKARDLGIVLYAIGLGDKVNENFLKEISPNFYFKSPDTKVLDSIYKKISQDICKLKPNIIEIIINPVY